MLDQDAVARIKAIVEASSPNNYMHALRKHADLVAFIEAATPGHSDLPLKARTYMVISGTLPSCSEGRQRPFLNIETGWGYCEKSKACACLTAHRSQAIKASIAAKKQASQDHAATATIHLSDSLGSAQLAALIRDNPRNFPSRILEDPALYAWVLSKSSGIISRDAKLSEHCYVALHGKDVVFCPVGNKRKFYSISDGYENSCEMDSHCACRRNAQATTMVAHHAGLTDEERVRRQDASKATLLDRHGVEYPAHVPGVQEKRIATSQIKYGVDHHMLNPDMKAAWADRFEDLYGVRTPGLSAEMQAKRKETNIERYGAEHTMTRARAAYTLQSGFGNPFNDPAIMEQARASMIERHGVEHALMSRDIFETMRDKLLREHGVSNVMKLEAVRAKMRSNNTILYGRPYWSQSHFSDASYAVLNDVAQFASLFTGRSLRDVAMHLGVAYDTARKYCYKHGVELPKSSYETAIKHFIKDLGFTVRQGDRTIIKPFELDLVIEERKLAIEFNGLYFHRDSHISKHMNGDILLQSKDYHRNKMLSAEDKGYRLITIFEDEWVHKQDIVKSRLAHALGQSARGPGARQCVIKTITSAEAKKFIDTHHIQGGGVYGFANYGAFHGDALVAVMTFSRGRMGVGNGRLELLRFSTDGRSIPGIADRLFKTFLREHDPNEVVSFADRRWSQGGLYRNLGFVEENDGTPGYFYIDCNRIVRFHRMKAQKNKIVHLVEDGHDMTEKEIMLDLGYEIVYDCGSYSFKWTKPR